MCLAVAPLTEEHEERTEDIAVRDVSRSHATPTKEHEERTEATATRDSCFERADVGTGFPLQCPWGTILSARSIVCPGSAEYLLQTPINISSDKI
ncbi:hypothetical protein NDU88_002246 [Pleurodeles waltl]|uniref:Uncharacterized protein n=1 Tax=Pleurodeles waltl TaxID=8319 RepID=A0AAV7P7R1_PLEWA|nr:hypothetical protein NDU88_002246 [Pleurodeles waltl]